MQSLLSSSPVWIHLSSVVCEIWYFLITNWPMCKMSWWCFQFLMDRCPCDKNHHRSWLSGRSQPYMTTVLAYKGQMVPVKQYMYHFSTLFAPESSVHHILIELKCFYFYSYLPSLSFSSSPLSPHVLFPVLLTLSTQRLNHFLPHRDDHSSIWFGHNLGNFILLSLLHFSSDKQRPLFSSSTKIT